MNTDAKPLNTLFEFFYYMSSTMNFSKSNCCKGKVTHEHVIHSMTRNKEGFTHFG